MKILTRIILALAIISGLTAAAPDRSPAQDDAGTLGPPWVVHEEGARKLRLYFFHSESCPHCREAQPFVARLADERTWLRLDAYAVDEEAGRRTFAMIARMMGTEPNAVPAFYICGEALIGYDSHETTGARLRAMAENCHARLMGRADAAPGNHGARSAPPQRIAVPLLGEIEPQSLSMPVLTVVLGGLDAFNPCAFFVLLFLLSLIVHARSRVHMAVVGGTFVIISGLMYFVFMAAWLNLFLVLESVGWVTLAAGLVAVIIGLIGIKDYVMMGVGPSLSLGEGEKDTLYKRMRGLIRADHLPTLLVGTVMLAIAANFYELICTSGFPMIYTRLLTLGDYAPAARYGYLALYNVVYVVPLLVIVAGFVWTLGRRKLSEREGRFLKLMSGLVMLAMGLVLIFAPALFDNPLVAAGILLLAVMVALAVHIAERKWRHAHSG